MPSFFNTWLPFIYLYGVGGIFFVAGLIITTKSKALDLSKKRHRFWFYVLIGGFFYFMIMHAIWVVAALYW